METSTGHVWTFSRLSLSCPSVLEIAAIIYDVIPANFQQDGTWGSCMVLTLFYLSKP
jgi:hypothetical protein